MEIKKSQDKEIIELSREDLELFDSVLHTCMQLGAILGSREKTNEKFATMSKLTRYISCAEMDEKKVSIVIE